MNKMIRNFTLIEALIAIAVLGVALVTFLSCMGNAANRMTNIEIIYNHQHQLTQAAEYYMLVSEDKQISDEFFDIDNYSVSCEINDAEYESDYDGKVSENIKLKTVSIVVENNMSGKKLKTNIDHILPAEGAK